MRAVVQRVTRGAVFVDGHVVGAIERPGLAVLVGVTHDDDERHADALARKVAILRGEQSVLDAGAPVLLVSQFTLYADTRKGRRPGWSAAAPGPVAEPLVRAFADTLRADGIEVATGSFGAEMSIDVVLDGPVTIMMEV
ncbi:MAG: D-aminoacyl-tRNA deacylase [Actinomycetales bacterium]